MVVRYLAIAAMAIAVPYSHTFTFSSQHQTTSNQTLLHMVHPTLHGQTPNQLTQIDSLIDSFWSNREQAKAFVDADVETTSHTKQFYTDKKMTYGEVTPLGVRQLADEFFFNNVDVPPDVPPTPIHFVDLGSGTGKLVLQMFLDNEIVSHSHGVELSRGRYATGERSLRNLIAWQEQAGEDDQIFRSLSGGKVTFENGDFLTDEIFKSLMPTTHVYIASLCFDENLMVEVANLIQELQAVGNLKVVASLRKIPNLLDENWKLAKREVDMTWGGSEVKFYKADA